MARLAKAPAPALPVPQSDAAAGEQVGRIGTLQQLVALEQAALNETITAATAAAAARMTPLTGEIDRLSAGLATWAAANRQRLTAGGGKTVKLSGGLVGWRLRPPKVTIRDAATVLGRLLAGGLGNFVRVRREINKEAILANSRAVAEIEGITVCSDGENFFIEPHAIDVAGAQTGGNEQ